MNNSHHHIPFSQLADLVEDRLTPDEREHLEKHINTCPRCSNELAQLKHLVELMRTDSSEDAPPGAIARAVALFRSRAMPTSPLSDLRRHILAVLRFDSKGLAPAFGVRSGAPGPRQLLYSAEAYDLDLRIEAADQAWIVSGQLLGESVAGGLVVLQGEPGTKQATLNQQSEFELPPAQAGIYKLILHLTDVDVEVDELSLGT